MRYEQAMNEALQLARQAAGDGDVPVGALVLDADGRMLGCGRNRREAEGDPLAHAEIEAMRQAADAANGLGGNALFGEISSRATPWNLAGCTLVVTLEPCPMCAGAALQTHVDRIVFGAWDAKLGACGSVWDIARDPHIGPQPEIIGGVEEEACAALLRDFFRARREASRT
ncbi:nucleoside deaminase [Bifidobacterium sp.]|jgi:tRNA(adenine34) deaminase|uniref:nucleoside deaminase n=1 Tax=Bifidobacterium sp. TaxID=41200 RepID=UPI0025B8BB53|nr:nucleoside deaminase [Bifidobacterium sp.]MCH4209500.1 nucleoside deaminase [Bifidobacterium sp.]MCI1224784.1 nucleoside deaminase [Bifidobacterium sp.]